MKTTGLTLVAALLMMAPLTSLASPAILSEKLYQESGWTAVETTDEGISIEEKNVDGIAVKAVRVSQVVDIDPEILAQVIEDISNYEQFLKSAPGMEAKLLLVDTDHLIGYQFLEVPVISDRVYVFKMFRPDTTGTRVDWELIPENKLGALAVNERSGVYIDVGVGSWSMNMREDGKYNVSYRLMMDPGGWIPDSVSDYFNRVSIVGIFKDALIETERRRSMGKG